MSDKTKKLTLTAMLGAMAYLIMLVGRIPVVLFLSYDPKDAIIAVGGFLLGPASAALTSLLVSLIEMLSASDTGPIGFFMNVLSTCAFVLPAAWCYRRSRRLSSAVIGLIIGVISMACVMVAWNAIITPLYMGVPRQAVVDMLIPVFLPFNLLKGTLNAALAMLIYKPVSRALKRARLLPADPHAAPSAQKKRPIVAIISLFVMLTAILCFFLLHNA